MRYSLTQIVFGMGSIFTGILMLIQPQFDFMMFVGAMLTGWWFILLPAALIACGWALLVCRLTYSGYRIMCAPLMATAMFVVARISVLQPDWWVTTAVLLTLVGGVLVSRRT